MMRIQENSCESMTVHLLRPRASRWGRSSAARVEFDGLRQGVVSLTGLPSAQGASCNARCGLGRPEGVLPVAGVRGLQRVLQLNMSGSVRTKSFQIVWKCSQPMYSLPTCSRL